MLLRVSARRRRKGLDGASSAAADFLRFFALLFDIDRLDPFGAVAIDRHGLEAQFPAFHVRRSDFFGRRFLWAC